MRRVPHVLLAALAGVLAATAPGSGAPGAGSRYLLAYVAGGEQRLAGSADGVRFGPVAGFAAAPGQSPTAVRRGNRLLLYDGVAASADGLEGTLRRFRVEGNGLAELPPTTFRVEAAALENAAGASSVSGTVALDADGTLVAVYALAFDAGSAACPAAGDGCVELRSATEAPGSGGTRFTDDGGNRAVLRVPAGDALGPPTVLAGPRSLGTAVVFSGPGSCLHVLRAAGLHGPYRIVRGLAGGCAVRGVPLESPSGLFRSALGEYWLYAVKAGQLLRTVTRRLGSAVAARRLRPLTGLGTGITSARIALSAGS